LIVSRGDGAVDLQADKETLDVIAFLAEGRVMF
jgi:hypothetical protein